MPCHKHASVTGMTEWAGCKGTEDRCSVTGGLPNLCEHVIECICVGKQYRQKICVYMFRAFVAIAELQQSEDISVPYLHRRKIRLVYLVF